MVSESIRSWLLGFHLGLGEGTTSSFYSVGVIPITLNSRRPRKEADGAKHHGSWSQIFRIAYAHAREVARDGVSKSIFFFRKSVKHV